MTIELNPGINPSGCAANPTCVAEAYEQPTSFPNNFKYLGTTFASIGDVTTNGTSNYNALQVTVNHNLSHGLQFLVSYTYSHALDLASGFENSGFGGSGSGGFGELRSTNPFNPQLDYGDSNYDARHRLVISYLYNLPSIRHFKALEWMPNRITDGWNISGITTFQSGFPLDVVDSAFPSLTSSEYTYYSGYGLSGWDVPNQVGPFNTKIRERLNPLMEGCLRTIGLIRRCRQPAVCPPHLRAPWVEHFPLRRSARKETLGATSFTGRESTTSISL